MNHLEGARPYVLRAINEWILDRGWVPHLLVDATWPGTEVPQAFIEDGRIVLNIRPSAVRDLTLGNEYISFSARFSGASHALLVPIGAVLGIYARENGEGVFFEPAEYARDEQPEPPPAAPPTGPRPRPGLKLVR